MKKIISAVAFATVANGAWAQVPELGDVLGELSTTELDAFNTELDTAVEPMLDIDLDVSFDIAVVNEAVSQGLITEQDAEDLSGALAVIEDNAGYFNFDFEEFIADAIGQGWATPAQISEVMVVFDRLPVAAKSIIGDKDFQPFESLSCTDAGASSCTSDKNSALIVALGGDENAQIVSDFYSQALVANSDSFEFVGPGVQRQLTGSDNKEDYMDALEALNVNATETCSSGCTLQFEDED